MLPEQVQEEVWRLWFCIRGVHAWGGYFPTKTYTSEITGWGNQRATGYVAAINGKLIATEVRVEALANWPDYVFGKDHNY